MHVAGTLRPTGALLTDLLMVSLLVAPAALFSGVEEGLSALFWVCGVVGYCLFAFRGAVPSLGRWALGLHRYAYNDIEEYAGRGILHVYESLPPRVYTLRTVTTVVFLLALAGLNFVLTRVFPSGST